MGSNGGFDRPFDKDLMEMMNLTAAYLCTNVQGCKMAYVQSDEISLLLTDFEKIATDAYFDGNIQKIVSITASMASAFFNDTVRQSTSLNEKFTSLALFDSRVFTIPDSIEVENYFVWRQQDCTRNSISMTAQSLYTHEELDGKNSNQMQDMCFEKGVNWNDLPSEYKRGRFVIKDSYQKDDAIRSRWIWSGAFWITKEREKLVKMIPVIE